MALQGDLNSFALPDVLRLLAGTGKSGRLEVAGGPGIGTVVLHDGAIQSGNVTNAPYATTASDVVFEILRFHGGSFSFEEGEQAADGPGSDVESAIEEAEALVAEWEQIEAVVPSMGAWVSMVPEIDGMGVHVTAVQWRTLAAIGSGSSVRELADEMALTDLAACRLVKDLADGSLVSVREMSGTPMPQIDIDGFDDVAPFAGVEIDDLDVPEPDAMTDLEDLVVDDRTVVMEDREDALLPEPLPGESVAYEGEVLAGTVDGHTFDHVAADAPVLDAVPEPTFEEQLAEAETAMAEPAYAEVTALDAGADDEEVGQDPFAAAASADAASIADELDEERGSLLKFLSTVKP